MGGQTKPKLTIPTIRVCVCVCVSLPVLISMKIQLTRKGKARIYKAKDFDFILDARESN